MVGGAAAAAAGGKRSADKVQNISGKKQKKGLDPAGGSADSGITITVDSDFFDCPVCGKPLTSPICQCYSGHIFCFSCRTKLNDKCYSLPCYDDPFCFKYRCRTIEMMIDNMKMACLNARHGCKELLTSMQRHVHDDVCGYAQCFCPEPSCCFSGTEKQLSAHFCDTHKGGASGDAQFLYGRPFRISLPRKKPRMVFQAPDGVLFLLLNDSSRSDGNAISLSCIRQSSGKLEFSFLLCVDYAGCSLRLNGAARGIRRWWDEARSTETSLVIPGDFFFPPAQETILELSVWNYTHNCGSVPSSTLPTDKDDAGGSGGDSSSITAIIDPDLLDCPVCFKRLTPPIYQCQEGHIWCEPCHLKLGQKCYVCPPSYYNYFGIVKSLALEAIIYSAKNACGNAAKQQFEDAPCFCPGPSCSFSGTEKRLAAHFRASHNGSGAVEFVYGQPFRVSLPRRKPNMVLQASDGMLFLLHNAFRPDGNAASMSCIRHRRSLGTRWEFPYRLCAKSAGGKLLFEAEARNVMSWEEVEHPSEFLLLIVSRLFAPEVSLEVTIWKSRPKAK